MMRNTEDNLVPLRTVFHLVDWTMAVIPNHSRWKIHFSVKYIISFIKVKKKSKLTHIYHHLCIF